MPCIWKLSEGVAGNGRKIPRASEKVIWDDGCGAGPGGLAAGPAWLGIGMKCSSCVCNVELEPLLSCNALCADRPSGIVFIAPVMLIHHGTYGAPRMVNHVGTSKRRTPHETRRTQGSYTSNMLAYNTGIDNSLNSESDRFPGQVDRFGAVHRYDAPA